MTMKEQLKKLHAPLGRLVISFSTAEQVVILLLSSLLKAHSQEVAMAVVVEMSFAKRLDALRSIAPMVLGSNADELIALVQRLGLAEEQRNTHLHSGYVPGGPMGFVRVKASAKRKSGFKNQAHVMRADDIDEVSELIDACSRDLAHFCKRLHDHHPSTLGFKFMHDLSIFPALE